jgi:hypothetical protein
MVVVLRQKKQGSEKFQGLKRRSNVRPTRGAQVLADHRAIDFHIRRRRLENRSTLRCRVTRDSYKFSKEEMMRLVSLQARKPANFSDFPTKR